MQAWRNSNDDASSMSTADPPAYRPLSGLAVAGLGLGALFAGALVLSFVISMFTGAPLPLSPGFLVLAIGGCVLS